MGSRDVIIVMAAEAAVERMRQETMQMNELLSAAKIEVQHKAKECEMLKTKKLSLLAMEADKEKVIDDFMLFIEAIDQKNDMEIAQNFDEKAMTDVILTMMNGGEGHGDGKK